MKKAFRRRQATPAGTIHQPMFRPAGGPVQGDGDAAFFKPAPTPPVQLPAAEGDVIQREEAGNENKEEQKDPVTEGLKATGKKLLENPKFEEWSKPKLDLLKSRFWESRPLEEKAALVGFAGLNLGVAGLAFGLSPEFRQLLSDVNIGKPLGWIPFSPVEGFKYKLPEPGASGLGVSGEFTLTPFLDLLRKKHPRMPLSSLTFGLDTAIGGRGGGFSVTGGKFSAGFFGGGLTLEGKTFSELSPFPQFIPGAFPGGPGTTVMQSVPGLPPLQTGPGAQIMVTADMLKLFSTLKAAF